MSTRSTAQLAEGIIVDLWRDFWIRETRRGQQLAQLHDRYMIMMMMMIMMMKIWGTDSGAAENWSSEVRTSVVKRAVRDVFPPFSSNPQPDQVVISSDQSLSAQLYTAGHQNISAAINASFACISLHILPTSEHILWTTKFICIIHI